MATVIVQGSADHANTIGTTSSRAFSSNVTLGNQILCSINATSNATLSSVTDTQGNTWTIDAGPITHGAGLGYAWFAHAENAIAGATTVSANWATSTNSGIQLYEVSGLGTNSFDAAPNTSGSTSAVSNPFTPTRQPAFAMAILESNNSNFTAAGTTDGWTVDWSASYNNYERRMSLAINSSGARDADGTVASSTWVSAAAVYMSASASGSTGTIGATLSAFSQAASGTTTIIGTISNTLSSFTSSITSSTTIIGTISNTLSSFVSSITGSNIISGTIGVTLAAFTSVITSTTTIVGTIGTTLGEFISDMYDTVGGVVRKLLALMGVGS